MVLFLEQVRGDGFAGVVRRERDRPQRDLRFILLPSTGGLDESAVHRNPPQLLAQFGNAGPAEHDENCGTESSHVERSALRGDSFLARLSDEQFRAGVDALQAYADRIDAFAPVTEEIDWFVFLRCGSRDAVSETGNRP